ncbi:putative lipoprotein [Methyloversatilis sp. RAC08]|uniref:hypothetical protein n=1 Tax=Methyloversatilis sp. RAC08 TaxID=1842540 RepID=UPI00083E235C|nr:hypothetical protein [Methyloversatilis sp. RAC08]AOF81962.1 putative lipoprotein [Methyloversatilis sp. RAC08]
MKMAMRLRTLAGGLISLLLLAGCATTVIEENDREARTDLQTVTRDAMHFTDLVIGNTATVRIDAASPTYLVDGSPRRFSSFSLPDDPSRRYLDYVSTPHGSIMIYQLKVLVPVFTFLDADRNIIETRASGRMENRRAKFEGRVAVPERSRYVIVHGTEEVPGPLIVHGDPGHSASIPGSRLGELQLTLSNVAMATVIDSGEIEDASKGRLFYLASVDGNRVSNTAAGESRRASSGQGFRLSPQFPSRLVPVKPLKVVVVGTHATGAPIHEIASRMSGNFRSVEAELDFTPEADKVYIVKGNLEKDSSAVWIEDAMSGQPVTKRGISGERKEKGSDPNF